MYDCRTDGGHMFVHYPTFSSFICGRCQLPHLEYNPSFRSGSVYRGASKPKAPWRCIMERCKFIACAPCAEILAAELKRVHQLRLDAQKDASLNAALKEKIESVPATKPQAAVDYTKTAAEELISPHHKQIISNDLDHKAADILKETSGGDGLGTTKPGNTEQIGEELCRMSLRPFSRDGGKFGGSCVGESSLYKGLHE